jgi:ketosteroid isomerase-like protein
MELYDEAAEIVAPEEWPEAGTFSGRGAVREQFERLKDSWEEERIEQDELIDLGERVLALNRWVVRGKGSGIYMETPGGNLITVRDRRIARIEFFTDQAQARRAAGL